MRRAPPNFPHFDVQVVLPQVVAIADCNDGGRSVTNGAEEVVKHLQDLIEDRVLIYRDSRGIWDEIVHGKGRFLRFEPIGAKSLGEALRLLVGRLVDLNTVPAAGRA